MSLFSSMPYYDSAGVSTRSMIGQDDLINLADVLMSIVNGPFKVSTFVLFFCVCFWGGHIFDVCLCVCVCVSVCRSRYRVGVGLNKVRLGARLESLNKTLPRR